MAFNPQSGFSTKPDIAGKLNALSAILANIGAQKQQAFQARKRRELEVERERTRKEEFIKDLNIRTKESKARIAAFNAEKALAEFSSFTSSFAFSCSENTALFFLRARNRIISCIALQKIHR